MAKYTINNIELEIEIHKSTAGFTKKHPFILVRGLGSQLVSWGNTFIKSITDAGYDVYIFDNRDSGYSTQFDSYGADAIKGAFTDIKTQGYPNNPPYTLYDMVDDVVGIINHFQLGKVHLAGCSMGGMVVQLFGQSHNDLLASLGVIFSTTGAEGLPPMSDKTKAMLTTSPPSKNRDDVLKFNTEADLYFGSPKLGVDFDESYMRMQKLYDRNYTPNGTSRQYIAIYATQNDYKQNRNITVPTLVLHGDSDPIFPVEHAQSIKDSIAGANMVIIENWGHDIPEQIANVLAGHLCQNAELGE